MEDLAASDDVGCFDILGRDDLNAFDQARKIRGVGGERLNDSGAKFPAAGVPIPFSEFIRSILYAGGEDVLAFRGEGRIENRWNDDVEIRRVRGFGVLGGVESAFWIVDFRADVDAAGERFEKAFCRIERGASGKRAKSKMDFGEGATRAEIFNAIGEGRIKLGRIDEMEEGALGVDAG